MSKTEIIDRLCVGVDLHKTQFTVCAMDEQEEVYLEDVFGTNCEGYATFVNLMHGFEQEIGFKIELAIETTGNARYFKNRMEAEGFKVVVVNTNKFKVISSSTKKNDANDAKTLAYYLLKEMLPEAHLCDQTSENIRRMIKTRSILVSSMVKIKNQIHGMMLGYGIETKSAQLQSIRKRQELLKSLKDYEFDKFAAIALQTLLNSLDDLAGLIKNIENELEKMTADNEEKKLLQTVPGIGKIGATTIAAYTKDMSRFCGSFKHFASYIGIVPSVHNSNNKVHLGKITKRGPVELRTAFVQVALGLLRLQSKTKDWRYLIDYDAMKKNKGSGRSIIALTRKIARVVFAMLIKHEEFRPELMIRVS